MPVMCHRYTCDQQIVHLLWATRSFLSCICVYVRMNIYSSNCCLGFGGKSHTSHEWLPITQEFHPHPPSIAYVYIYHWVLVIQFNEFLECWTEYSIVVVQTGYSVEEFTGPELYTSINIWDRKLCPRHSILDCIKWNVHGHDFSILHWGHRQLNWSVICVKMKPFLDPA